MNGEPLAVLVVRPGTAAAREVPIHDRIFVGRECFGIDEQRRVIVDDRRASRNHLEIRLEPERRLAYVIDGSTNGTRLNGVRLERGRPTLLASGDRLTIGGLHLEYRSALMPSPTLSNSAQTARDLTLNRFVTVVGDVIGFSTIAQSTSSEVVLRALDALFGELRRTLTQCHGTLGNLVGDAFFAVWEVGSIPDVPELAMGFATAAVARVRGLGAELGASLGTGQPLRMGWGASIGEAAVTAVTGTVVSIVGDASNVAFRLAALAGRDGRGEVLVTEELAHSLGDRFTFGPLGHLELKGRLGLEPVRALHLAPA
jgi:adenylate cyclase